MSTDTNQTKAQQHRPSEAGIRSHLGDQLRQLYGSVASEPVPDRLTALLDALERQEREASGARVAKEESE